MDDQFGGPIDDDLFYDDFEPVVEQYAMQSNPAPSLPADGGEHAEPAEEIAPTKKPATSPTTGNSAALTVRHDQPSPQPRNSHPRKKNRKPRPKTSSPNADATTTTDPSANPKSSVPVSAPSTNTTPPSKPHVTAARMSSASRLQSGGLPRERLTEEETAAMMKRMREVSNKKARDFELATLDQEAHARGLEEAQRRRTAEAEHRKRGEEDRRKMEEERAKNRERKLRASGMREEGGWDEGKAQKEQEQEQKLFKSAQGGIRGVKRGGLAGSRFAPERADESENRERSFDDAGRVRDGEGYGRGRGRGRGRGGGRRGGEDEGRRSGPDRSDGPRSSQSAHRRTQDGEIPTQPTPKAEEFPALPGKGAPKVAKTQDAARPSVAEVLAMSLAKESEKASDQASDKNNTSNKSFDKITDMVPASSTGKWDEEVQALEEEIAADTKQLEW